MRLIFLFGHSLIITFLISPIIFFSVCRAANENIASQLKIDTISDACHSAPHKDKICEGVVLLKQIGDDSVEAVKEYVDLGPKGYAALTVANWISIGRIRIRTRSFITSRANHTYDIQKDKTEFLFQMDF